MKKTLRDPIPQPAGFYRLLSDVINPRSDRRFARSFSRQQVWPKELTFELYFHDFADVGVDMPSIQPIGCYRDRHLDRDQILALLVGSEYLGTTPPDFDTLFDDNRKSEYWYVSSDAVLRHLHEEGWLTLEKLAELRKTISIKWDQDAAQKATQKAPLYKEAVQQ